MGVLAKLPSRLGVATWLASALLPAGCATTDLHPLDLSGPPSLESGLGILLLHVDTDVPLSSVTTSAGTLADVPAGDHLYLLAVRPGRYYWKSFTRKIYSTEYIWLPTLPKETGTFAVQAGTINDPGVFVVRSAGETPGRYWVTCRILDRSAETLQVLEREHPAWLAVFSLRHAALAQDEFLSRYLEARERTQHADAHGGSAP